MSKFSYLAITFILYTISCVYAQNNLNEIESYLVNRIKNSPNNVDLNFDLGMVYLQQGIVSKAIEQFQKVVFLSPNDSDALLQLGILLRNQGKLKVAEEMLERCVKIKPENYNAWYDLGIVKSDLTKNSEAIDCLQKCVEYLPKEEKSYLAAVYFYIGIINLNNREIEKANAIVPKLAQIDEKLSNELKELINIQ